MEQGLIHVENEQLAACLGTQLDRALLNLLCSRLLQHCAEDEQINHVFVYELLNCVLVGFALLVDFIPAFLLG